MSDPTEPETDEPDLAADAADAADAERAAAIQAEHDELRQQTIDAAVAAITAANEAAVVAQAAAHRLRDREWMQVSGERAAELYAAAANAVRQLPVNATQQEITLAQLDALAGTTAVMAVVDKAEIEKLSKAAQEAEIDYVTKRDLADRARHKAETVGKLGRFEKTIVSSMLGAVSIARWMKP